MKHKPLKIGVFGCNGRVGSLIVRELDEARDSHLVLAGGSVRKGQVRDAAFYMTDHAGDLVKRSDVLIDFTNADAAPGHAALCADAGKPVVIGVTGLSAVQERDLDKLAQRCPVLYAANMSIGINLLLAVVERAAARLGPEWDIEIAETHHRFKKDAPSGTALALGRAAAQGRGDSLENLAASNNRTGQRQAGDIGFAVRRGGDIVGEHSAGFYALGEVLEFRHMATDRAIYARGAIRAAAWLAGKKPGLYSMQDVIGLG